MNRIVSMADLVMANKRNNQFVRMGLGREALDKLNPSIIAVQLTGHRGERSSARDNFTRTWLFQQGYEAIDCRRSSRTNGMGSCVTNSLFGDNPII